MEKTDEKKEEPQIQDSEMCEGEDLDCIDLKGAFYPSLSSLATETLINKPIHDSEMCEGPDPGLETYAEHIGRKLAKPSNLVGDFSCADYF